MNTAVALERPLQTGDLSEAAVQAWLDFVAMPSHERCLRLTWMAESRAQAAVLWRVSEHHRMTKRLGTDLSYKSISAHDIARRFGLLFGCSQRSIGQALSDLLDEGMLLARPHVDNVTRKHRSWIGLATKSNQACSAASERSPVCCGLPNAPGVFIMIPWCV